MEDRWEAEAKAKRIERWHQTGRVFQSLPELRWLFIELALANGGELDWHDKERLTNFVAEPMWGLQWGKGSKSSYFDNLVKQGGILVASPKFQCTVLRDFFIVRIVSCLIHGEKEQQRNRIWYVVWTIVVLAAFIFFGAWGLLALAFPVWSELGRLKMNNSLRQIFQEVNHISSEVQCVGYDEPTIIRRLEPLEQRFVPIPSVLYALLRLPRRNVEHEISKAFNELDSNNKEAIWKQWQEYLDGMLKYDER
jgi:hypothetical protein